MSLLGCVLTVRGGIAYGDSVSDVQQQGDDGLSIDDILGGFDKRERDESAPADDFFRFGSLTSRISDNTISDHFSVDGSFEIRSTYNFAHDPPAVGDADWRGMSSVVTELKLECKAEISNDWLVQGGAHAFYDFLYDFRGRDRYTSEVLDEHGKELELDEFFLVGSPVSFLDLKVGRQIVAWGRSDIFQVTDVINPLDLREPGMTDIEDLRLPLTMTRIDSYFGSWNITGLVINEIRFDKLPAFGDEFNPATVAISDEIPRGYGDNTEYGVAANAIFSGWGCSFYYANIFDDIPHAERTVTDQLVWRHSRLTMFGAAADVAFGNVLLKTEVGYFNGLEFFYLPGQSLARIDVMIGLEYSGLRDTSITVEVVNRHMREFDQRILEVPDGARQDIWQVGGEINRNFFNDTLSLSLQIYMTEAESEKGGFERLEFKYDLGDSVSLSGGAIWYQSVSQSILSGADDNDRLFLRIKYSF